MQPDWVPVGGVDRASEPFRIGGPNPRHLALDLNEDLLAGCTLRDRASRSLELRRRDERSFAAFKVSTAL